MDSHMDVTIDDKRHILCINEKSYMFFLCFKSDDEYIISSQERNMVLQHLQDKIIFSFLSDRHFNMFLKNQEFYLYGFLIDRDIKNGSDHLRFIYENSMILRYIFQRYGFEESFLIDKRFIKLKNFKINKNNIENRLKNKSQNLLIYPNVNLYFNVFKDNNECKILCCHPSITINIKDVVDLLK